MMECRGLYILHLPISSAFVDISYFRLDLSTLSDLLVWRKHQLHFTVKTLRRVASWV